MTLSKKKARSGSVTLLLEGLCRTDEAKTKEFWEIFFPRLVRVANRVLTSHMDAEDAAQAALVKFWRNATTGKVSHDLDRFAIWSFLSTMTIRQAIDLVKYRSRKKRGAGRVFLESELNILVGEDDWNLDRVIGDLSLYAFDMILEELLDSLSPDGRAIVVWKLMGYSNREISEKLGYSERQLRREIAELRTRFEN